jgi:hypothetical protein
MTVPRWPRITGDLRREQVGPTMSLRVMGRAARRHEVLEDRRERSLSEVSITRPDRLAISASCLAEPVDGNAIAFAEPTAVFGQSS